MCNIKGCSYLVFFIDDHSIKVWAFVLKFKGQVLYVFKHLHAIVERETSRLLKYVRANYNGACMGPFEHYCKIITLDLRR